MILNNFKCIHNYVIEIKHHMLEKNVQPIIGSGFLASNFKKYLKYFKKYNVTIYAAGISNSLEKNSSNLKKEIIKAKKFLKKNKKKIVYISTYSVEDESRKNKLYVKNKIKIEKIIKNLSKEYLIIRLPEIIGKNKNLHTLSNFFFNKIVNKLSFVLYKNVKRNILDVDDALKECIKIIKINKNKNNTINLLNKTFYSPEKIVTNFEKILLLKAKFKIKFIKKNNLILKNNYYFKSNKNYLRKVLKKYYC